MPLYTVTPKAPRSELTADWIKTVLVKMHSQTNTMWAFQTEDSRGINRFLDALNLLRGDPELNTACGLTWHDQFPTHGPIIPQR